MPAPGLRVLSLFLLLLGGGASEWRIGPPAPGGREDGVEMFLPQPRRAGGGMAAQSPPLRHDFYFTRAIYSGRAEGAGWKEWNTDSPKAERQFLAGLRRLLFIRASPRENFVRLDDLRLRRYPFLYLVEAGHLELTQREVEGLRGYLLAGGLLVADDFWGTREWRNFASEMRRVLPEYPFEEVPPEDPLFHTVYDIEEVVQVPNVGQGIQGGPTHEQDGFRAAVRGVRDAKGRLLVVANWNTDLGDGWEWAESEEYPLRFSTYAYQMGTNIVVYSMTH